MDNTGVLDVLGKLITKKNFLFIVPPSLVLFSMDSYNPDLINFWTANECGLVAALTGLTGSICFDFIITPKNRTYTLL